jgi:chromosome segregation protein
VNLENRRDNLNFQLRAAKETKAELLQRQDSIRKEIDSLNRRRVELQTRIEEGNASLNTVKGKIQKERSILDLKHESTRETFQTIESLQAAIRNEQQSRETYLEELKRQELELARSEEQITLIKERIRDRYNRSVPPDLAVEWEAEELEQRIARLQRSIENIGPINMAVQDEYNEESQRLITLNEQRADLLEAEENLRETIQKIDRIARKQFQETFDQIKLNFEKLFTLFFEGGQASLSLVGDPDPLEADIAIHAQPPGKRNQTLRMLSAGEKSLTAIALLFAIYQYKPSPYCILDEVDAPLDDVNIKKFTRVLTQFSRDTQFIIVTHNKLTMEVADYMYGVTMEQKGISKLVSVRFNGQAVEAA